MFKKFLPLPFILFLTACGGESQVKQNPEPPTAESGPFIYLGPPPTTQDIQEFKVQLWENIISEDRCGGCHNSQVGQAPYFARTDDINLAYNAANELVSLRTPEDSTLVQKVAGGHNCWLSSPQACSDIMTTWIANWANIEGQTNVIKLVDPVIKDPSSNKSFPAQSTLFATHTHPLTSRYCASCHASSATIPISPYFAEQDLDTAYQAAQSKIDLNNPELSRLVLRLSKEFHNCWGDCQTNANEMLTAINSMASAIPLSVLDNNIIHSKALTLPDGIIASGGSRFEQNVIAKYQFKTGSGTTAFDTSGIEPALDLTLSGEVDWIGGWGVQFINGRAQGSTTKSKKLYDLISATGEYAIEAWVTPANVTQEGPARIISYSGSNDARNVTLGQTLYNYDHLLRTTNTNINGMPAQSTPDADEVLQASLQHVVVNYDPVNGRTIYVNGEEIQTPDTTEPGTFTDWDPSFALILGNETSGEFPWAGSIRMLAIHNRILDHSQIQQNYSVGVGERFYLLFNITDLINVPQSYFVFEVSQFDNYSYLFQEPFFISLDKSANPQSIPLIGMRIGINGSESPIGQAFKNLNLVLGSTLYNSDSGQHISRLGTLIPLENGAQNDEFFLTFEKLGTHENIMVEAQPQVPLPPPNLEPQSRIGVRIFSEINATMSQITRVPVQNSQVKASFNNLKQQLPSVTDINSFLSSHQMAVSQMAIKYCNELVEDSSLRAEYFPGFDFDLAVASAFSTNQRDLILMPLLNNALLTGMKSQADLVEVKQELNNLIDTLSLCSGATQCDSKRTKTIVKASCAALVGSAVSLLQ
ncbi:LamG domain-containing protein [Pseudoalteromonas denitrificans]|uniref:Concanavalin A-like lectin/glucanases superfamily protein n=1 Tax=Pseudoalteromonas denitrificans DSM 6059 TaxID=1123010 RepID=A0A1I1SMK1_9GAMM|nr:LamG domain-containing protein [Pseudoalteromonas denitrificans]SFD47676.1 Concanavalin A-like lectin/glucanases superfamily protein [Pseudoalteromonas denitrificans DSM 6059]